MRRCNAAVAAVMLALAFGLGGVRAATVGSLQGTVVDAANRHPIAGARLQIASASGTYRTVTDARGFYSIVGVIPDTYAFTIAAAGYLPFAQTGIFVTQDSNLVVNAALTRQSLREIAHVAARSGSFPVQPHQPIDVYEVSPLQQAQLGGMPGFDNESL